MPYLNCPACRLTVYAAVTHAHAQSCPRCSARLGDTARSMFGPPPPAPPAQRRPPGGASEQLRGSAA